MKWIGLVFLMCFFSYLPGFAQNSEIDTTIQQREGIHLLQTTRGDIFFGKTLNLDQDSVVFQVQGLTQPVSFDRDEIFWLGLSDEAAWLKDKFASKFSDIYNLEPYSWQENLAYSMTAFPYAKGAGEYRNISILYNIFDVGLSDNFSIGGGLVVPFLFMTRSKLAFKVGEKFHLGAGLNNFLGLIPGEGGFVSHLFAIGTLGSPEQYLNITAGTARDWDFPEDSPFIITIGGGISFASNWKIYTDIGLSPGNEGIIPTFMLSWFKKQNRLEIGVLGITDGFISAIPMIGYAHRF